MLVNLNKDNRPEPERTFFESLSRACLFILKVICYPFYWVIRIIVYAVWFVLKFIGYIIKFFFELLGEILEAIFSGW